MELKKPEKSAKSFVASFTKKALLLAVFSNILIVAGIFAALYFTNKISINDMQIMIIILLAILISFSIGLIVARYLSNPTRDLIAALLHTTGEKTDLTPPNINSDQYAKTGFKDAIQTIYNLSVNNSPSSEDNCKDTKASAVTAPASTNSTITADPFSEIKKALDQSICGFIALDQQKNIIYHNDKAPVQTDTDGKPSLRLYFNDDNLMAWLKECDEKSVHNEKMWQRVPDRMPNEEGRRFFDVIAVYDKDSSPETVLSLIDRTDKYAVDEESLDFIAFAAHELRGPITVIRGYLDVLNDELDDVLQNDQHELFRRLIVSANRLSGYINNILNTSRYDRRHLKIHLSENTLSNVYDMISDDMSLRAKLQNRLLSVNIPADLPTIAVDQASMSEVLGNLIDNAIKYSNEGGAINVAARANGNFVEVAIQDHGIGMPESVVRQLFQKFYRSHRSRETVAGTGIGLYISKAIVESHGGMITVNSEDGRGSTFVVTIPIYSTVADKLKASDNSNEGLIKEGNGWIKNHSMYRG